MTSDKKPDPSPERMTNPFDVELQKADEALSMPGFPKLSELFEERIKEKLAPKKKPKKPHAENH